ncbi:MAG: hypothetical protein JJU31_00965 [Wenzhouxiangella sp.]|nr:hypothetical protein [Wenzhouxiangella sp.]TVR94028.1 MAG: hypothetical protein EA418_11120 [Wenzhouxiangellaceae bacterium]
MRWMVLIAGFCLAACGGGDSEPADEAEHLLSAHQRALDDARAVDREMRERLDRMEDALEEAAEQNKPAGRDH